MLASKVAFTCNVCRYVADASADEVEDKREELLSGWGGGGNNIAFIGGYGAITPGEAAEAGLYETCTSRMQLTHSLKAPGFSTLANLKCDDILVSKFAFKWVNLYRYAEAEEASAWSPNEVWGAEQLESS